MNLVPPSDSFSDDAYIRKLMDEISESVARAQPRKTIFRTFLLRLRAISRYPFRVFRIVRKNGLSISPYREGVSRWRASRRKRSALIYAPQEDAKPLTQDYELTFVVTVHDQSQAELSRCFTSISSQTFQPFSVIVVDDGSESEETKAFLTSFFSGTEPSGWLLIRQENQGVVRARNIGLEKVLTEFVCFVDPDDELLPTFAAKLIFCGTNGRRQEQAIFHSDVIIRESETEEFVDVWRTEELRPKKILSHNTIPVTSVVRTRAIRDVGGWNEEFETGLEDYELWVRMSNFGYRSVHVAEPLYIYSQDQAGRDFLVNKPNFSALHKEILDRYSKRSLGQRKGKLLARTPSQQSLIQGERSGNSVVFFMSYFGPIGGAEKFLKSLTLDIIRQGKNPVFIFTSEDPEGFNFKGIVELSRIAPHIYYLPAFSNRRDLSIALQQIFRFYDPDLVLNIGSVWFDKSLPRLRGSLLGKKTMVYSVLFNTGEHAGRFVRNERFYDGVVVIYKGLQLALQPFLRHGLIDCRTIYIGSKRPTLRAGSEPKRERLRPKIGWLGRISPEKKPDLFIDLARRFGDRASFHLAGSGPLEKIVEFAAQDVKVLSFVGQAREPEKLIREFDLLVLTSEIEGISNSAMEAIAHGVPVLSTDVGGMRELIEPGVNGLLAGEPFGPALRDALQTLLDHNARGLRLLQATTRSVGLSSQFSEEAMLRSFEELLQDVMTESATGSD